MRAERWLFRLPLLLRTLLFRRNVEQELDEEIQYHLERQFELNKAAGMSDDEAWREARRSFGNIEARKEYCRDHWAIASLDRLSRDLRQALRVLRRERAFSVGVLAAVAVAYPITIRGLDRFTRKTELTSIDQLA